MRAVVIYESMYGNTHLVADAIAEGLASLDDAMAVPVHAADKTLLEHVDLVVAGGPTHAHGMSRESTRKAAMEAAGKPGSALQVDPDATGTGLREWLDSVGTIPASAAAFDTRVKGPAALTGRAAKGIGKVLPRHGMPLLCEPESFFVDKTNHLLPGEEERARAWGERLAAALHVKHQVTGR